MNKFINFKNRYLRDENKIAVEEYIFKDEKHISVWSLKIVSKQFVSLKKGVCKKRSFLHVQ